LITGASGGAGYACARAFAAKGADLILSDIDGHALKLASNQLGALGLLCDVASEASVAIFAAEVLKSYPSIDVLINAAGRSYVRNLGTLRITRAFLPIMKSDGGKKDIINIAPMGGAVSDSCYFPYAASQEAFDRLAEALAESIRGTKVALTTIVPSILRTAPDGACTDAVAAIHAGYPRDFRDVDHDQVAAAVVEAVRSGATRRGQARVLRAHTISNAPCRLPARLPGLITRKRG
jgi:NAD(P)-dependent dehydrogenase (short-subunit alcohol dehydrogenase family)